jgi:hypothetical protein
MAISVLYCVILCFWVIRYTVGVPVPPWPSAMPRWPCAASFNTLISSAILSLQMPIPLLPRTVHHVPCTVCYHTRYRISHTSHCVSHASCIHLIPHTAYLIMGTACLPHTGMFVLMPCILCLLRILIAWCLASCLIAWCVLCFMRAMVPRYAPSLPLRPCVFYIFAQLHAPLIASCLSCAC